MNLSLWSFKLRKNPRNGIPLSKAFHPLSFSRDYFLLPFNSLLTPSKEGKDSFVKNDASDELEF